ncbi:hypothetical protein [Mucilaginibacter psychrotolerans]|uniref:Lipoprotein n=1 Tax=Mucilaginibacter psychrotolerans TaxID=1524096 RepID=A0A4Y8SPU6_9SPHI|nr:hypothetical protein [Mucilaginibacter psychrotolerans]TFF40852.1 hypothetical protein E2R66_01355 [Mucilaginibacter psychrotolerans]
MMLKHTFLPLWIFALAAAILVAGCKNKTATNNADPRETNRVIDSPSVAYIKKLDKENKGVVFVFTKDYPEFKHLSNRSIVLKPLNQDLSIDLNEYQHKDYMGPVYILLPAYYVGIRASVILKCFPAYKGFTFSQPSDGYVVYYTDKKR